MSPQPIFLVGVPRSGSTMLRLILDSHPSVFSTVELPWIGGNYFSDGYGPEASVRCLYRRLANASMQTSSDGLERIKSACRAFVEQVIRTAMAGTNKTVWVEKTPDNIIQVPFLAELFPDAKFLRVIRDGRDVALSTLNVDWRALNYFIDSSPRQLRWINVRLGLQGRFRKRLPLSLQEIFLRAPRHARNLRAPTILYPVANTFYNALYRWQVWNELYERCTAELAVPQLTVRYEDLLLDPQGTFPEIFKFIEVGWDDRVLNYGEYRHEVRQGDVGGSSAMRFERVAPENAYKWKTRLTRRQRRLVRTRFDPYLVSAAYDRTPPS
jgi:protein-tyrosine sulfotransferase